MAHEVNRYGEGCLECGVVGLHHEGEIKVVTALLNQWCANEASSVCGHEVDHFWGRVTGCDQEVALIFTVLIVNDNNHFSSSNGFNCLWNGVQHTHGAKVHRRMGSSLHNFAP